MIPLPMPAILPKGTFLVTEDLVTALARVPDTFTANGRPLAFPTREGPWLFLPNGSTLNVREDTQGGRLTATIRGAGEELGRDLTLIMHHLD